MDVIQQLTEELVAFRDARDWEQFHNSKDLALGLSIEAAELNELFLWKKADEVDESRLREELADVIAYALLLAHKHDFSVADIVRHKIALNAKKYPVDKARGSSRKYTEYED
ncbi:MAG: nucleotide pyrophosphohydrolase [Bacteroidota bacterium]